MQSQVPTTLSENAREFQRLATSTAKFKLFMLKDLPLAFFAGLKVARLEHDQCQVRIDYKWINKNPFRSMYFAAQAMAAELSTGALAMMHVYKEKPRVSMLVFDMKASFSKKAVGRITFTCLSGNEIAEAVRKAKETGQGVTVDAKTIGTDQQGERVSEFVFTWTFKVAKGS